MDNLNISKEDLKLFLEELDEQIEVMEEGFLTLEREGADPEVVSATFRAAHTVKGSSAAIGHQRMTALTHAMENVMDKIRQGELGTSSEVMNPLLKGLDLLRPFKQTLATNSDTDVDISQALQELRDVAERKPQDSASGPKSSGPMDVSESFMQRIHYAQEEGLVALEINVTLAPESIMPSVRAYQVYQAVASIGEILASDPTLNEIEDENVGTELKFWIITASGREAIRSAVAEVTDVTGVSVSPVKVPKDKEEADRAKPGGAAPSDEDTKSGAAAAIENRTVRVDVTVLDSLMNLIGELVIDRTRLGQLSAELSELAGVEDLASEVGRISNHLARITGFLQEEILKARMLPIEKLFKKFPRMVRDLSMKFNKPINFEVNGKDTELDRAVIEMLSDPLMHLLRNAIDHGLESPDERRAAGKTEEGNLTLSAYHSYNQIVVEVSDDGRGIDPQRVIESAVRKGVITPDRAKEITDREAIMLIFSPGFSTAEKVSEVSGRGVGLDVVRKNIDALGGRVDVESDLGRGTTFRIFLPLTLATVRALMVRAGGQTFAIPLNSVVETLRVDKRLIKSMRRQQVVTVRDMVVPIYRLESSIGLTRRRRSWNDTTAGENDHIYAVIVNGDGKTFGLVVDSLVGEQEIVIKSLGRLIGDVRGLAGATILGDGSLALILDIRGLTGAGWSKDTVAEVAG